MSLPRDSHDFATAPAEPHADTIACGLPWCTTDHGATTHPDDEDHRSAGIRVPAVWRDRTSTVHETEIEVGLLRRVADDHTWFVLEDGSAVHLELRLDTAQHLAEVLSEDRDLRGALCPVQAPATE